jgi:hypothetical protein
MPDEYASVTTDGLEVSSNSETLEEMQAILAVKPEETPEKPESTKPSDSEAKSPEPPEPKKVEPVDGKPSVDATGREHDEKGRFKAKPIPDKPEEAKAKEKPAAKAEDKAKPEEEGLEDIKKPHIRQRIERAARAAAEQRQRADEIERENRLLRQALEVKKETEPKEAPKQPAGEDAPPELTEGKDPVEFVREMSEYAAKKAQREADQRRQMEDRANRFQQEAAKREETFAQAMEKKAKADPDFAKRINPNLLMLKPTFNLQKGDPPPNVWNALADEITASSLAPEILIHLSEHEDELQRIATLGPRGLTRAMAKLEAKLEAATTGTPAPVPPPFKPSAAEPVTPVTGAATTADGQLDAESASFEDWFRIKNEQDRKRRRA